ncbi:MAG: ABC transporter permease [Actinomycetota bacterium]|nr:ABC transporter permease [Actinomycetota bacterium]
MSTAVEGRQAELVGQTPVKVPWVLPVIAAVLVFGTLIYIRTAELDSIEARALTTQILLDKLWEHILLVAVSTVAVIALGIPLGIILSRRWARYISIPVLGIANAGQAIPSIGMLVLLALIYGVGFKMAVVSLVLYALLPILRNTMVGLKQVDPFVIDAAKGMGMSSSRILFTVELPLAVPVMLAGVRVALILNVGVATLATYTNAGGLGDLIERGIVFYRMPILLTGCLLTISLALMVDWLAGLIERKLRPKGL